MKMSLMTPLNDQNAERTFLLPSQSHYSTYDQETSTKKKVKRNPTYAKKSPKMPPEEPKWHANEPKIPETQK
jgi:hypothetical protein